MSMSGMKIPFPSFANNSTKRIIKKLVDTTITNDNTVNNDPELFLFLDANKKYKGKLIYFLSSPTTADFASAFGTPSGIGRNYKTAGALHSATPLNSVVMSTVLTGATNGGLWQSVVIEFEIETGANSGNLTAQWSQQTADAGNTVVYAGSYMEIEEI